MAAATLCSQWTVLVLTDRQNTLSHTRKEVAACGSRHSGAFPQRLSRIRLAIAATISRARPETGGAQWVNE